MMHKKASIHKNIHAEVHLLICMQARHKYLKSSFSLSLKKKKLSTAEKPELLKGNDTQQSFACNDFPCIGAKFRSICVGDMWWMKDYRMLQHAITVLQTVIRDLRAKIHRWKVVAMGFTGVTSHADERKALMSTMTIKMCYQMIISLSTNHGQTIENKNTTLT